MKPFLRAAIAAAALVSSGSFADDLAVPSDIAAKQDPFEQTKLVSFKYSANQTFPIVARSGMFTVIEIPEGEVAQGFYLSDTDQWGYHIAGDKRHVFVKPAAGKLFNSGTLITDKRTYLLALQSGTSGMWYQKVTWTIPEKRDAQGDYEAYDKTAPTATNGKVDGTPNFEYDIEGNADFRPLSVYDNGKFTRFVLSKNVQELPALFSLNSEGQPEVVNYTVQGNALQVNRLMNGALLKLGDKEVRVYNRATPPVKKRWYSFSGWGG